MEMGSIVAAVVLTIGLLILLLSGLPIGLTLGAISAIGILVLLSPGQLGQLANIPFSNSTKEGLIIVPLFILMAEVIVQAGFAKNLFDLISRWFNAVPGALAVSSVMSAAGFAAACGSSTATAVTIGRTAIPEMTSRGYKPRLATGSAAVGGTLGILIPPSLSMIIFGIATETSIVKLFIAGLVPGIMLAVLLSAGIVLFSMVKPSYAPRLEGTISWSERFRLLPGALPVLVLAVLVLVSIYTGIVTLTETAALAAALAVVIGLAYRKLPLNSFPGILLRVVKTTGMLMLIVFGGMIFSYVLTTLNIPALISQFILRITSNPWLIITAMCLTLLVLGCLMDAIAMIVITMPFFFPMAMDLGFHPLWFGVIVTIMCEVGLITPPVGLNLFVIKGIVPPDISFADIIFGSLFFIPILLLAIVILLLFPDIALWLPKGV